MRFTGNMSIIIMMEREQSVWKRILHYREELVDICEHVTSELTLNRNIREEWRIRSEEWKLKHLPGACNRKEENSE